MKDKFLGPVARINTHQANDVDILQDIDERRNRGVWIYSYACLHAQRFYLLNIAMKIRTSLDMYSYVISPGFFKFFGKFFGLKDHQVNIKGLPGSLPDKLNDHWAITDIGNESSIHYVKVKPIGL